MLDTNKIKAPKTLYSMSISQNAALQVIQQAVDVLARWAGASNSEPLPVDEVQPFVEETQRILSRSSQDPNALQLVFDRIHLAQASPINRIIVLHGRSRFNQMRKHHESKQCRKSLMP